MPSLIRVEAIAAVLGIKPLPHSVAELDAKVAHGLPKQALVSSVGRVCTTPQDRKRLQDRLVPPATFKRRARLSAEQSARAERLARVFATAAHVWADEDDARKFMTTPHAMLGGITPLEVSLTELGARRVEDVLLRLFHGIAA